MLEEFFVLSYSILCFIEVREKVPSCQSSAKRIWCAIGLRFFKNAFVKNEKNFRQSKVASSENLIERSKEGFNEVALRGAVLYDVNRVMAVVNPLYHCNWERFLK